MNHQIQLTTKQVIHMTTEVVINIKIDNNLNLTQVENQIR